MSELTAKQKDLLYRIVTKPELQPFFFRKAKGLEWFDPLNEKKFFSPDKNPRPRPAKEEGYVNIPTWPITEYLVATSHELSDPENEKYAKKFLEIIRNCTEYAITEKFGNYRTWWQFAKIIKKIPPRLITLNDVALVGYWLEDPYERGLVAEELGEEWLIQLLSGDDTHCHELAVNLLEQLYLIKFVDRKNGTYKKINPLFRFDNFHAKKITSAIAVEVGSRLGLTGVQIFHRLLLNLIKDLDIDRWSSLWRPAIEEPEQNHGHDEADDILIEAFRDSLLGFVETKPKEAARFVSSLLDGEHETIKRVSIYVLDQKFPILPNSKTLVDQILREEYFKDNFRHELWNLLKNRYEQFKQVQQEKVINIITNLSVEDDYGNAVEKASAYQRADWLSSIKDYEGQIDRLYEQNVKIAGVKPDNLDFSSPISAGRIDHKSPFNFNELRALSVDELIGKLNGFENSGRFGEPSLEGLVKCFKDVVKAEPLKFYIQLEKFINSDLSFVYELIEAYRELWVEKQQKIPWDNVWASLLNFFQLLTQSSHFWSDYNSKQRGSFAANRHLIVGAIGRIIEYGTKSDEHAFHEKLLGAAEHVLLLLLEKQEGVEFKNDSDAVIVAINSPRGRCIEALINLSLRSCRLADKAMNEHSEVWQGFESIYDNELLLCNNGVYEFATLVANYLPNFLYMSNEWVYKNLNKIFNQKNYQQWLCAIQGYAYVNRIFPEVYKHLKKNGDFIKALDDENVKEKLVEKIIQNIVFAYITDEEDLNDQASLICILLRRRNYDEISQVVWFIWSLRGDDKKKLKTKVFELWPKLLSLIDLEVSEGRKLASNLSFWSVFVERIDNINKKLLLSVAPYADEEHNSFTLLENLARISIEQPFEAHEIWLKMLEGSAPDYPKEALEKILWNLSRKGSEGKRKAFEVADAYLKRGNSVPEHYLHEIKDKI